MSEKHKLFKTSSMSMSNANKRKLQTDKLEYEVLKKEEEFKYVKQLITKRSYLNDEYQFTYLVMSMFLNQNPKQNGHLLNPSIKMKILINALLTMLILLEKAIVKI